MNALADAIDLPPPKVRNWLWRCSQFLVQACFTFWLHYRARGLRHLPEGGALLLMNHQSFLDPLLVGVPLQRPVSFLARDSLFRVPVIGWLLRNTYVLSISREAAGMASIREAVRRLQHGYYVGVFPEGTRSTDGKLGPLKPGFQLICRRAGVPIVPVGIAGAFEALPRGSWWLRPVLIRVVHGPPISAEEIAELCARGREAEFVQLVTDRIQQALTQAEQWLAADLNGTPPA